MTVSFSLYVSLLVAFATLLYAEALPENGSQDTVLIGTVDGKSYFVNQVERMTWFAAKRFCQTRNMQLAEITNAAQAALFMKKDFAPPVPHSAYYWVNARESREPREFTWDMSKQEFASESIPLRDPHFETYATCLFLYIHHAGSTTWYGQAPCGDTIYVMCEN